MAGGNTGKKTIYPPKCSISSGLSYHTRSDTLQNALHYDNAFKQTHTTTPLRALYALHTPRASDQSLDIPRKSPKAHLTSED